MSSNLLLRYLGLIICVKCLQQLLPAQPSFLWDEVPTRDAENCDCTEDHASLHIIDGELVQ